LAIVDPLLHVSMPPKVTADTGMDALSHVIESYITRRFDRKLRPKTSRERPVYGGGTPLTDIFAEKAIELIGRYLRRAVYEGDDIEARSGMGLAATLAGVSLTNAGLTAVHTMAFPVSGQFHTTHGETISAIPPAVIEFFLPSEPEKFGGIAKLMCENIEGLSTYEAAKRSIDAVIRLMRDINAPNGLHTFEVKKGDIQRLAKDTMKISHFPISKIVKTCN